MTPVTGGITDGEKNRFVLFAGKVKCVFRPGVPVDRVIGVLQKIGTFFMYELIGSHCLFLFVCIATNLKRLCLLNVQYQPASPCLLCEQGA